ncbi:MAG: hypothetical protein LUG50_07815 [Planctomycetaceae bacterium]|nr:hypothetical protein [Planctomycetaceae bacterium]
MSHKIDRLSKPVSPVLAGVVGYTVPKKLELSAVGDFLTYLEENASRLKKIANFDNAHIRLEAINMLASWGGSVVQDPTGPGLNNHAAITYWINQIAQVQPYDGEYAKAVLAEIRALTPVTEKYDTFTVHDRELRLLPEYNNWLWGERGPGAGEPGDDYPLRTVFRLLNVDKDREAREAFWRLLFSDLARTEVSDLTAAEREILAFVRYGDFNKAKRVAMEMLLAENIPHFFYVQKTMIQGYADNGEPDKALDEYLSAYHLQLLSGRYAGTGNGVPDYSSHFREVASLGVIPEETMIKRTMLLHMKENLAEHESGAGGRRLPFLLRRHSYAEDLMLVDLNNLYADLIDHMANTLDGIPPPPGGFQPIPGGLMSVFQTGDAGGTWDDSDSHLPHELDTVIMKHNARFQSGDEARTLRLQIRGQQLMDDMMRLVRDSVDGDPYSYTPVMSNKEIQELTDKFMKDSEAIAYGGAGAEIPPLPVEIIAEAVFWGKLYREHWHYDSAGAELQKALDVIDENPEEDAFTAYEALAELVILSAEYGRFRDSETLGNRLRQAAARFSGGDTWDVMSILCDVEMARNDYPAALEAVTLALKQAVRDDGVWHSRLRQKRARVLMQLGMVDYALADLRKSVEIFQEKLGRHNEETLNCALDIVGCLLLKGDRDEAAARYAAAVAGLPPSHGKPRFLYRTHQLRGIMAFFAGDLDGALEHMEAALAVIDAAGRLEIDDRYDIVKALANIHYRRGDVAAALREIDDINRYRVQRTYAAMDAATVLQRYSYIDAINSGKGLDSLWLEPLDLLVAILVRPENAGHITVERLDSLVNGKAVALDSLRRGKYEGEIDRDEFREYVEAKSRLAQLWIERGESGRRIAPLREAGEAGIIQAFERERYGTTEATPDAFLRLQTLLPDRAVIVDYHRYRDYRSGTAGSIPDNRYAALVLSGTTYRFVDLGEADGMDEQIDSLLAALDRGAIDFRERAVLVGLRNRLLGPVEAFTRGKDRLIVCPDAAIGNVPFALLHDRSE